MSQLKNSNLYLKKKEIKKERKKASIKFVCIEKTTFIPYLTTYVKYIQMHIILNFELNIK